MPFELSWIPGGSVGFLINLFGFFELTMVVVRGREEGAPLKLPAAFPEGKPSTMSWDDQVAAEEGNNMVSGAENVPKKRPTAPSPYAWTTQHDPWIS